MAEVSRNNVDSETLPDSRGEFGRSDLAPEYLIGPELPESATPANNPALNRSAEAVGRGVGTAVAGVRSLPRQIDKLRSRIHLVNSRAGQSSAGIIDSASGAAAEWRDSAEKKVAELRDSATAYTHDVTQRASRTFEDWRRQAEWRVTVLRRAAHERMAEFRRMQSEQPLQAIVMYAGAAFALGVALRIWRSRRG